MSQQAAAVDYEAAARAVAYERAPVGRPVQFETPGWTAIAYVDLLNELAHSRLGAAIMKAIDDALEEAELECA
jgi:hypothetical protein